jgi:predicted lipoprotein with Yx(FWY)xxD motif
MSSRRRFQTALVAVLALSAIVVSACGGSSSTSKTTGASSATVDVKTMAGYGKVLVTASGQPLYVFSSDPSGGSKCTGSCAKLWKPLTQTGAPSGGPGVNGSLLSSFTRTDAGIQILYNKQALYTYTGSGLISAEGLSSNGGDWYLIAPSGKAITKTTAGGY